MTRLTDEELGELERLRRKPMVLSARIKIMQAVPSLLREVRQHRAKEPFARFDHRIECSTWASPLLCCTCGLSKALEG